MGQINNCWERVGWLRIDVSEACEMPWGYGLAYRRYDCYKAVCYPLGLNWAVWILCEIYFRIIRTPYGIIDNIVIVKHQNEYNRGYSNGFHDGMRYVNEETRKQNNDK